MRVLLATDGSPASLSAARFAAEITAASRGTLFAVTVGNLSPRFLRQRRAAVGPAISAFEHAERRIARNALETARRQAIRAGAAVRCEYVEARDLQPIAETISRLAKRRRADLIVVGSRGGSPLSRWALGSVANRLLHVTQRPVVIVGPGRRRPKYRLSKILVATDGSVPGTEAVRFAARLASAIPRSRLVILTVSTLAADVALTGPSILKALGMMPELKRADRRAARRVLDKALREARSLGRRVTVCFYVPRGRLFAAEAIVSEARRQRANLIVLGRARRGGLGDVLVGSVAQRALTLANGPVAFGPPGRRARRSS